MAQKQFKIGLSNTDKQNMAQDVYERVLALTFNEYDTTTEYEVGDFVVYNDQLYKCIGATSGAWDSTKWQLATLNDLVTDIESAVAFVNDKANVNGNYPTMTVGFADNLTPYDESAGDDQDEPFSFQATGTGNGTQPDFSTGSGALMKEKQGNTVVVNQYVLNVNKSFSFPTTATGSHDITNNTLFQKGHKYLLLINQATELESNLRNIPLFLISSSFVILTEKANGFVGNLTYTASGNSNLTKGFKYLLFNITSDNFIGSLVWWCNQPNVECSFNNASVIDLTQWFNGDIPQDILDNPSNFFRYYQGSLAYNEGELVNANGRYIKCIGMNQWDEEWESGSYNITTGAKTSDGNRIRNKNPIKVIPNATYYIKRLSTCSIFFYDMSNNYLTTQQVSGTFTIPSNCGYICFSMGNSQYPITTYTSGISINLYYEDEPRCLTYEPYQVLTNNDTGTEVLRKAGNVADIKLPSGEIKRNVGVVDFGDLIWAYNETDGQPTFVATLSSAVSFAYNKDYSNLACSKYIQTAWYNNRTQNGYDKTIAQGGRVISVRDSAYNDATAFKTAMSGVYLFYELAEPTTEQGTPYSENLVIDDFGSMSFEGTSGVPQGNLIFYPVDYKAFIDTLYKYTDGTPSNIALKSDVASEQSARESVDTQLKNALGGTLRQCLCVKESLDFDNTDYVDLGTLNWNYNSSEQRFYCFSGLNMASIGAGDLGKIICTKYKTDTYFQTINGNNKIGYYTDEQNRNVIAVKDTTYTDATTFKNAMKGVLLAYEKASS